MSNSRITSLAFMVAAMAAMGSAFPVAVELHNNTWTHGVEPETCTEALPYQSAPMVIRDADQFQRVLSNLEGVNALSCWVDGAGLFIVLPGADEALAALEATSAADEAMAAQGAGTGEVAQEAAVEAAPVSDAPVESPETVAAAETEKPAAAGKKRT